MKKNISILIGLILITSTCFSQVAVNMDGSLPDSTAALHVDSDSLGFLPPRMTTAQRDAIVDPADGLMIYNYDNHRIEYYDSQNWRQMFQQTSTDVVCGNDFYDTRDNRIYGTVWIGGQCWMRQNLNYGGMIDGSTAMTQNGFVEKYCYDDTIINCTLYGGLYQWDELMAYGTNGTQGICPDGWHVPSSTEFDDLASYLGGWTVAGGKMKQAGTVVWQPPNTGATNESGFTGLPGGYRSSVTSNFVTSGYECYFWSSTENSNNSWSYRLYYLNDDFQSDLDDHLYGFSARCIKDN